MSLDRNRFAIPAAGVRDERADYIEAHLAQLEVFRSAGLTERANEVVVALRALGHEVDKVPTGTKERAVENTDVEKAVPADEPAAKRRRTKAE